MDLRTAVRQLPRKRRKAVEDCLNSLSAASAGDLRAAQNVWAESRLPASAWDEIIAGLVACAGTPDQVRAVLVRTCQRYILKGPTIAWSDSLGRAVTSDRLADILYGRGYFASHYAARRSIRNLLGRELHLLKLAWRGYELGSWLAWGTFDPANPGDAFRTFPTTADGIRGVLGLSKSDKGRALLLLRYSLPKSSAVRFPTIAEAYAGAAWNYFFTPATPGSPHGRTLPWPEYEDHPPRPEVVHEVLAVKHLNAPIVEL